MESSLKQLDPKNQGRITSEVAVPFFQKSGLSNTFLSQVNITFASHLLIFSSRFGDNVINKGKDS